MVVITKPDGRSWSWNQKDGENQQARSAARLFWKVQSTASLVVDDMMHIFRCVISSFILWCPGQSWRGWRTCSRRASAELRSARSHKDTEHGEKNNDCHFYLVHVYSIINQVYITWGRMANWLSHRFISITGLQWLAFTWGFLITPPL